MSWEIRYIRKIDQAKKLRLVVQDASWRIGALLHDQVFENPFAEDIEGQGGIHVTFTNTWDDNFATEAPTFESWVTGLNVEAIVGEAAFQGDDLGITAETKIEIEVDIV